MDNPNEDKANKIANEGGEFYRVRTNYEGQRRFTHLEKRKNKPGKVSAETDIDINTARSLDEEPEQKQGHQYFRDLYNKITHKINMI